MQIKAYAKINLSLDVVGKREDGYHLLRMIMQSIDIYDLIKITRTSEGISISCDKPYVPVDERNLAYKAARLFLDHYNINQGVTIDIKKNIPVAAGLAGGSTDAASVLKCMRALFKPDISIDELKVLGLKIGADVPYCIGGGTAVCEGIGEICTTLKPFRNKILVVVKPGFGVSTKEVYAKLDINKINKHPNTEGLIEAIEKDDLRYVCRHMKNVLENVTLKNHLVLRNIKGDMLRMGAYGTMMSGSGPTIFAFFTDMLSAQRCYDKMKLRFKETFITRTI